MTDFKTKICTRCKRELHVSFFYYEKGRDRYISRCKECMSSVYKARPTMDRPLDDSVKFCTSCGETKSTKEFVFYRKTGKYFNICKLCQSIKDSEYHKRISIDKFNEMLNFQGGKCVICKTPFDDETRPYVDHDHNTEKVRGILCNSCNILLGKHQDDAAKLRIYGFSKHADYLERFKENNELAKSPTRGN